MLNNCKSCKYDYLWLIGNHIPLEDAKSHLQITIVNNTEAGKYWCNNEVRALIHMWSDEKIKQMHKGTTRNKNIWGNCQKTNAVWNRQRLETMLYQIQQFKIWIQSFIKEKWQPSKKNEILWSRWLDPKTTSQNCQREAW